MLNAFLSWDGYIFPKVARFIYYFGLALIALGTVISAFGGLFGSGAMGEWGWGLLVFIGSLIGGALGLLVWRVTVELWTVLFSVHDVLIEIRDQGRK